MINERKLSRRNRMKSQELSITRKFIIERNNTQSQMEQKNSKKKSKFMYVRYHRRQHH